MAIVGKRRRGSGEPDVSVITAVYNTMPYLTACLESLTRQSIGLDHLEIVAIDDGSTDESPQELARFAKRYPSVFRVVRQEENSGGPARPSNRGLELATGRYVFFIGSDDVLGPQALQRMVTAADAHDADVVAGRMVGLGGRYVPQGIFARTDTDVDLYNSELPFAVSNTKLFRRELLTRHGIRYLEDVPMGSDQPFTVAACVHAKRIVALADYDYYFAVKRAGRDNITYSSPHELRLRCVERIMEANAALLEAGPRRDAVLRRSFFSELSKLTRRDFLRLDRDVQERLCAGIGHLADRYLTENIRIGLEVGRRVRISLAQRGLVDELITAVEHHLGKRPPEFVRDSSGLFRAYPFFRDERALPDAWFFVTDKPFEMMAHQLVVKSASWKRAETGEPALTVTAASPYSKVELEGAGLGAAIGGLRAEVMLAVPAEGEGTTVRLRWPLRRLAAIGPRYGGRVQIMIETTAGTDTFRTALVLHRSVKRLEKFSRVGLRGYILQPVREPDGEFAINFAPTTPEEFRDNMKLQTMASARRMARPAWRLARRLIRRDATASQRS